ncbi:MAG TPA: 50S ribosomal protein L25 [Planctomycetaceae bacterium]|nr:50S ribosomal protein L25 [Planctomycetaceae bacterium]
MPEVLQVESRTTRGKNNSRRLRKSGKLPAILYGHGEETVSLTVAIDAMEAVIRHGSHVVELDGAVKQSALIRELQWNTWGTEIVHVDFARVSADEVIEVTVPIELRGEAPGLKEGGILEHLLHEIDVECKATLVPDRIKANVNHLQVGGSITVADLDLPEGAKWLASPEAVVVQCVIPAEVVEEEGAEAGEAEPEVIGGKKEEDEGDDK